MFPIVCGPLKALPSPAATSGAARPQTRHWQHGTRIFGERPAVGNRRWLAEAPTICVETQTGRPPLHTEHNRRSSLRCRYTSSLERLTSRRHLCTVSTGIRKTLGRHTYSVIL